MKFRRMADDLGHKTIPHPRTSSRINIIYSYLQLLAKSVSQQIRNQGPSSLGENLHAQQQENDLCDDPGKQHKCVDEQRHKQNDVPQILVLIRQPTHAGRQLLEIAMWRRAEILFDASAAGVDEDVEYRGVKEQHHSLGDSFSDLQGP